MGEIVTFLEEETMSCVNTQKGLVELINQLVYYREEGRPLFPEIFVIDDISTIQKILKPSIFYEIGSGEKTEKTMLKALKKCAPLAEGGWSIYIQRNKDSFDYGLCRTGTNLLSVSMSEALIENGTPDVKAILIHQLAEKIIEVRGVAATALIINFSTNDTINSPISKQNEFIDLITLNVDNELKEQTKKFFSILFLELLQIGHGTLACLINSKKKELPKRLQDGIILKNRINVSQFILDLNRNEDLQANHELEGCISIVSGMMQSDGITVFSDAGEILAYNVFIKHPEKIQKSKTSGGARSRTFLALKELIGNGLEGAYVQSQDGNIEIGKK